MCLDGCRAHLVTQRTYTRAGATQISNEMRIETRYLFYRSSDSFESYSPLRRLRATQRRSALEGTTKVTLVGVFSNSFFSFHQMISSLTTAESTVTDFLRQPQSLRCSSVTPSRLGLKSPRVTNANHEIDNMHKCSSGRMALFEFHSTHKLILQV